MYRTFNCGVGMVICVAREHEAAVISHLNAAGHSAWIIGTIASGESEVEFR
jgi:phosphoribosylformylglycinamidine cyclo-ligase